MKMFYAYRFTVETLADFVLYFRGDNVIANSLRHYPNTFKSRPFAVWDWERLRQWIDNSKLKVTYELIAESRSEPAWSMERWTLRQHGITPIDVAYSEYFDHGKEYVIPPSQYQKQEEETQAQEQTEVEQKCEVIQPESSQELENPIQLTLF